MGRESAQPSERSPAAAIARCTEAATNRHVRLLKQPTSEWPVFRPKGNVNFSERRLWGVQSLPRLVRATALGRTYCQWRTCQPGRANGVPQLHHPRGVGCINVVSGKPNTIPGVLEHALLVMRFRTRTAVTHRKEEIKLARKRKLTRALSVRPVPERFSTSSDAQRKIRIACSGLGDLLI